MSVAFPQRLADAVRAKCCPLAIGLDPRPEALPAALRTEGDVPAQVTRFLRTVIDLVAPLVPCVKPQVAFFEVFGHRGVQAYEECCAYATEKGLLVIGDVKRGDIGSTAEAYARAHFRWADAVTLHPLLGTDSVAPFLVHCRERGKGVFMLVRTSNPSATEFQARSSEGTTLSEAIADAVHQWGLDDGCGPYSSVGAVVGATYAGELARLRGRMPRAWILLPGVGAQGGRVRDLAPAFDGDGLGGLIAISRAATQCFEPDDRDWQERIVASVQRFRDEAAVLREGS